MKEPRYLNHHRKSYPSHTVWTMKRIETFIMLNHGNLGVVIATSSYFYLACQYTK